MRTPFGPRLHFPTGLREFHTCPGHDENGKRRFPGRVDHRARSGGLSRSKCRERSLCTHLGDTGADGTQLFSFRVPPLANYYILVSARDTNIVCPNYTLELFGLPCPPPALRITKGNAPGSLLAQWSTAYPDYRLQSTNALRADGPNAFGNVASAPIVTGGKYTVTNSAAQPRQFFRLAR